MTENKVIGVNDFEIVCRICLGKKEKMISMFENSILPNLIKTYREMLEECASVQISTDDLLPKNICLECINYLEQSYKFKIQYLSTEILLEQIIASVQPNIKVEVSLDEDVDFKNEDNSFNFYNSDEGSLNESIKKELVPIKEEPNSNKESNDNNSSTPQKYKCTECDKVCKLKSDYYKHQKITHSKIVKCLYCDKTFDMIRDVRRHSPEIIRCKICKQICGCKTVLKKHVNDHSVCMVCGKEFKNVQACNRHLRIHGAKRYLCTLCGKAFSHKTNYIVHLRKHTGEKPRTQRDPNKTSSGTTNKPTKRDKGYLCTFCGKTFVGSNYSNYIVHVRTHTGEKPYPCTQCEARFNSSAGLHRHVTRHSEERRFECEICKRKFKNKAQLGSHRRIQHLDNKKYSCDLCNKEFKRKDYLREHEKIHTGERNYCCTYCNKAFYKSYKLKMHLRTHTGEKPFSCARCGKMFDQKFILNNHMKTHQDVPPPPPPPQQQQQQQFVPPKY